MNDLMIIVPTRGRPRAVAEIAHAVQATTTGDTAVTIVIDDDDPDFDAYVAAAADAGFHLRHGPHTNMIEALNCGAGWAADQADNLMFMGDDHRPRTLGFDTAYLAALADLRWGWVYGNDLIQGPNLPTQFAVTSDVVRVLGHMSPPEFKHLYMDNWVLALGTHTGRIRYLPDVIVEHLHPVSGKVEWDDGYRRVNAPDMYSHDQHMFDRHDFTADVDQLRKLMPA